jgi:hypothetical protein
MAKMFNRWIANRAFNALIFWLDWDHSVVGDDYETTVATLDVLRTYIHKKD